jgi:hypothetical protein
LAVIMIELKFLRLSFWKFPENESKYKCNKASLKWRNGMEQRRKFFSDEKDHKILLEQQFQRVKTDIKTKKNVFYHETVSQVMKEAMTQARQYSLIVPTGTSDERNIVWCTMVGIGPRVAWQTFISSDEQNSGVS